MSKISLSTVTGANNQTAMNSNFTKIAEALNNRVLWRDNIPGEPNQLIDDIDSNNKRIYNLPEPVLPHEAARLKDLLDVAGSTEEAIQAAAEAAASATEASQAQIISLQSANSAQTAASTAVNASIVAVEAGAAFLEDGVRKSELESAVGAELVGVKPAGVPNTVTRTAAELLELKATNFIGVDPTGLTDSTVGLYNYIQYIYSLRSTPDAITGPLKVDIPRGKYQVGNLNLTNLVSRQLVIEFNGSIIIANQSGKPVIDALDSRWVRFQNGTVYSPQAVLARSGIQLGNSQDTLTVGNNYLDGMFIIGWYVDAPYVNVGSETTYIHACNIENRNQSPSAYAAIFDGMSGKYYPTSDFRTVTRTPGRGISFTNNGFGGGTQFRNGGGGVGVFLASASGFTFDNSCYVLSLNDAAFELFGTGTWRNKGLVANVQFENSQNNNPVPGNLGIRYGFKFTSDGVSTNTAIDGLKCDTFGAQCEDSMFYNATGGQVRIGNLYVRMSNMHGDGAQLMFNKGTGSFNIDGEIHTQEAAKLNLGELASFTGIISVDNATLLPSRPITGAYTLYDRVNRTVSMQGAVSLFNYNGSASPVTIGNAGASYLAFYGSSTHPQIRAVSSNADADISLIPQGAGLFRYGTRTARTDTPVTGSMPMRTADGTTVYLALVAAP